MCAKVLRLYHLRVMSLRDGGTMDWLLTEENLATALVVAGFCLFSYVMCLLAR
jgi:hypothetical protein